MKTEDKFFSSFIPVPLRHVIELFEPSLLHSTKKIIQIVDKIKIQGTSKN